MESNELRIGNMTTLGIVKNFYLYGVHTGAGNCVSFKNCEPVELTEDLLFKFGFEKIGLNYQKGWLLLHRNNKTQNIDFLINEPITNKLKVTTLKSVHQLQNLYFAITNEELSISVC